MGSLRRSAEYICVATGQIGIDFNTNEYGPGPQFYVKLERFPETAIDWQDPAFKAWLENENATDVIILHPPATCSVIYDEKENLLMVEMVRLHSPGIRDYEAYAIRCGCGSSDEAVELYGDLQWCFDSLEVLVKGTEVRQFLDFVVPYCWAKI